MHGTLGLTATRSPTLIRASLGADRLDDARDLVAEDHRLAQPHGAEAAVVVIVQVGAADAAEGDPHANLARAERRNGASLDPEVLGGVGDDGAHGDSLFK